MEGERPSGKQDQSLENSNTSSESYDERGQCSTMAQPSNAAAPASLLQQLLATQSIELSIERERIFQAEHQTTVPPQSIQNLLSLHQDFTQSVGDANARPCLGTLGHLRSAASQSHYSQAIQHQHHQQTPLSSVAMHSHSQASVFPSATAGLILFPFPFAAENPTTAYHFGHHHPHLAAEQGNGISNLYENWTTQASIGPPPQEPVNWQQSLIEESERSAKSLVAKYQVKEKPVAKPKRALSAYNIFFQKERKKLMDCNPATATGEVPSIHPSKKDATLDQSVLVTTEIVNINTKKKQPHGKVSFETLAKIIGQRWKSLEELARKPYQDIADTDKKRYQAEVEIWKRQQSDDLTEKRKQLEDSVEETTKQKYLERANSAPKKLP